jgi:Domain of unknown function (DUF6438)
LGCKLNKMKKLQSVFFIILIGVSGFAKEQKKKKTVSNPNQITSLSVYHSACFGRCPVYRFEINRTGLATYTGIAFIPDSGTYTKKFSSAFSKKLLDMFGTYRLDTCKDTYVNRVTDAPGLQVVVHYGGKTKTIDNAHYGPMTVRRVGGIMDSVLGQQLIENKLQPLGRSWHKTTGGHK